MRLFFASLLFLIPFASNATSSYFLSAKQLNSLAPQQRLDYLRAVGSVLSQMNQSGNSDFFAYEENNPSLIQHLLSMQIERSFAAPSNPNIELFNKISDFCKLKSFKSGCSTPDMRRLTPGNRGSRADVLKAERGRLLKWVSENNTRHKEDPDFDEIRKMVRTPASAKKTLSTPQRKQSPTSGIKKNQLKMENNTPVCSAKNEKIAIRDKHPRCMVAGYIPTGKNCKPNIPKDGMSFNLSGKRKIKVAGCGRGQQLCNPMIFGFKKSAKGGDNMQGICAKGSPIGSITSRCYGKSKEIIGKDSGANTHSKIVHNDRRVATVMETPTDNYWGKFTKNFLRLCDDDAIQKNYWLHCRNGKSRGKRSSQRAIKDVQSTCASAKRRLNAAKKQFSDHAGYKMMMDTRVTDPEADASGGNQ